MFQIYDDFYSYRHPKVLNKSRSTHDLLYAVLKSDSRVGLFPSYFMP